MLFVLFAFWPFCSNRKVQHQTCLTVFQNGHVKGKERFIFLNYLETGILAKSIVFIVLFGQEHIIHSVSIGGGSRLAEVDRVQGGGGDGV